MHEKINEKMKINQNRLKCYLGYEKTEGWTWRPPEFIIMWWQDLRRGHMQHSQPSHTSTEGTFLKERG